MTKDTNESKEEPSKNQEMKSMWSAQSAQSHWNPSVLMSSWMSSWPIQSSNKTWFRGQDQDVICQMANGIVSLAWVISSSAPRSVYSEYFWVKKISLPTMSMANRRLSRQNRHFGKVSKTNMKLAKFMKKHLCSDSFHVIYMCLLLAAGQSTASSFFFPSSEEHGSDVVNVKFEFVKFHLVWGHGPRVAMCSWFQVLPQTRHVWNCLDHWSI